MSGGLEIAVHEWGASGSPPLMLAHGGFDFARTFDVFAPLLADAGWRVVSWDHRGHGDSSRAALYSWTADTRDMQAVLESTSSDRPIPLVAHSKGGGLALELADASPWRVAALVNIDGLPSDLPRPDVADHERRRMLGDGVTGWLDRRRAQESDRKPGTIEELAARRGRMNPRLTQEWLEYLVTVGGTELPDGWRWKLDPIVGFGGFGPWRPGWALERLPAVGVPLLAILGTEQELMGMGATVESVTPWLPPGAHLVSMQGCGHFVHIERPAETAALVIDFLASAVGAP